MYEIWETCNSVYTHKIRASTCSAFTEISFSLSRYFFFVLLLLGVWGKNKQQFHLPHRTFESK